MSMGITADTTPIGNIKITVSKIDTTKEVEVITKNLTTVRIIHFIQSNYNTYAYSGTKLRISFFLSYI